ncbi:hypothetical protein Tco_0390985 [Tanacetum coccineum]
MPSDKKQSPGELRLNKGPARLAAAIQLLAFGFNCGFGRRLSITLHKVRNECPLYDPEGRPVGDEIDSEVEHIFNRLLDKVTEFRQIMGKSADISLSSVLERLRQMYTVATKPEEKQLNDCHFANLEYANAGGIWRSKKDSLNKSQDDSEDESKVEEYPPYDATRISSTGGGLSMEDDLDCYDGYEAQVYNLSRKSQDFCDNYDIRVNSRVRK